MSPGCEPHDSLLTRVQALDLSLQDCAQPSRSDRTPHANRLHKAHCVSTLGFLDLPAELRLAIYDYALVARFQNQDYLDENWNFCRPIFLHHIASQCSQFGVGLLSTCKTVHREATPIFFSQNTFQVREGEELLKFLHSIGPATTAHITRLHLWIHYQSQLDTWLQVWKLLASTATGLRELHVGFGALHPSLFQNVPPDLGRGYGENVEFVRAMAEIRTLDELLIEGFYGMNWPAYLQEKTGAQVRMRIAFSGPALLISSDDMLNDAPRVGSLAVDDEEWELFREYQRGTENIFP